MSTVDLLNGMALTLMIGGFVLLIICLWGMFR